MISIIVDVNFNYGSVAVKQRQRFCASLYGIVRNYLINSSIYCQDYEPSAASSVKNEADVGENPSHVRPVVATGTLSLPRYSIYSISIEACQGFFYRKLVIN